MLPRLRSVGLHSHSTRRCRETLQRPIIQFGHEQQVTCYVFLVGTIDLILVSETFNYLPYITDLVFAADVDILAESVDFLTMAVGHYTR